MAKLSVTTKLDGIKSWSLPAITTCPGARDSNGDLVPVCQGCYATEGRYRFANVQAAREFNRQDWKRKEWVDEMVDALQNERYFRWFDSGDIHNQHLAGKMYEIMLRASWVQFWLPTRSYKIKRIRPWLESMKDLKNVSVRYSADEIDTFKYGLHGSVVISDKENPPEHVTTCNAYKSKPAQCNGCRACWDKKIAVIGYPAHGSQIKQVVKLHKQPSLPETKVA